MQISKDLQDLLLVSATESGHSDSTFAPYFLQDFTLSSETLEEAGLN